MTIKTPVLSQKTLETMWQEWAKIISLKENGLLLFAPRTDRIYRIDNFVESSYAQGKNINILYLGYSQIEDEADWRSFITSFGSNVPEAIFIVDAEILFTERRSLLPAIARWSRNHQRSILLFSEKFPYTDTLHSFIHHKKYYPLYEKEDLQPFLNYLSGHFSIPLSQKVKQQIIQLSAGHLWLVKHMVRFLSTHPQADLLSDPELFEKGKKIIEGLISVEHEELHNILLGKQKRDSIVNHHLTSLGLDKIAKNSLFSLIMNKKNPFQVTLLQRGKIVYAGSVPVNKLFSPAEYQALTFLLKHRHQQLSRETMAMAFWGEDYLESTDWALDQAVRRLRKKLKDIQVGDTWITTKKGVGYDIH